MLRNVHPNYSLHHKLTNLENRENAVKWKIVKNVKMVKIGKFENRSVFEQNVDEVYVRACARAHLVVVYLAFSLDFSLDFSLGLVFRFNF